MGNYFRAAILCAITFIATNSCAFTAIASIPGEIVTLSWTWNSPTQKVADTGALEGCRVAARQKGLGSQVGKCKVLDRAKGPGYGALSCGNGGCAWVTGYADNQTAVDEAYQTCSGSYKKCNSENIDVWEDTAGFQPTTVKLNRPSNESCVPTTKLKKCNSTCENGNCLVTYENACQIRVQVQPELKQVFEYDPAKGKTDWVSKWVYPAPSC